MPPQRAGDTARLGGSWLAALNRNSASVPIDVELLSVVAGNTLPARQPARSTCGEEPARPASTKVMVDQAISFVRIGLHQ